MSRRSRARPNSGGKLLMFGLLLIGSLIFVFWSGQKPKDWPQVAADKLKEAAMTDAVEAADRGLAQDPGNYDLWYIRAQSSALLGLHKSAIHDIRRALELSPNNSTFIVFETNVLAIRREFDEALKVVDAAHDHDPKNPELRLVAASTRLNAIGDESRKLAETLAAIHPEPFKVASLIDHVFDSSELDSPARRELLDPLAPGPSRDEVMTSIDHCWTMLHEADRLLGDVRGVADINPRTSLSRAEIDLRLGRLLQAKEELQVLLTTTLQPSFRREALLLLAKVMEHLHVPIAEQKAFEDVLEMDGGEASAPLFRLQDVFEAQFHAAELDQSLRAGFLARVDAHLKTRRATDMRTCGYRGIAALEWENKPEAAIDWLSEVYDALRMKRDKDTSILDPTRVERFILALLDAHVKANQIERGLAVANALVDLSPRDPELRKRRATLFQALQRPTEAAADLLVALRNSRRDSELFASWLKLAQSLKDPTGNTPLDRAKAASAELRAQRQAVFDRLRTASAGGKNTSPTKTAPSVAKALTEAAGAELRLARDPAMAWLMAEEYARAGEIGEAQNLMFRATHDEPDVKEFRFRQAIFSLDEGHFAAAAEGFQSIFESDPADTEAARFAIDAWDLAGNLEASRRVRADAIRRSPGRASLVLPVLKRLQDGDPRAAIEQLRPFVDGGTPDVELLLGMTYLDLGQLEAAKEALERTLSQTSDQAGAMHQLFIVCSLMGDSARAGAIATELARQTHVIPLVDVEKTMTRLEAAQRRPDAAVLARALAPRFSVEPQLQLEARASRDEFLSGDPKRLRDLRDQTDIASRLDDVTVMACFGLTLRENGAKAAAEYLQHAREYTTQRATAALPTALAYALTPFTSETTTFLKRYVRDLGGKPVPLDDVLAWWIADLRLPKDAKDVSAKKAEVEPGAEGELLWLLESYQQDGATGSSAWEDCARFLLFQAAGPGFEADTAAVAEQLIARDARAQSAARYLASRTATTESKAAAVTALQHANQAVPTDLRTALQLGKLLVETDPTGVVLFDLAQASRTLFPSRLEPILFVARAEIQRVNYTDARVALDQAADRWPADPEVLKLRAELAVLAKDDELASTVASAFAERPSTDPALRDFVLARYGAGRKDLEAEAHAVLGKIVAAEPTFFAAACVYAGILARAGATKELDALAKQITAVVPADRSAGSAGEQLALLAGLLQTNGLEDDALALIDAGLFADPTSVALRQQRIGLLNSLNRRAETLEDLRLLCALAPRNKEVLLQFTTTLLAERADQAQLAAALLKPLAEVASADPRLHLVRALLFFRADQLEPALAEYAQALSDTQLTHADMFTFGVWNYIAGKADMARKVFASLPTGHPLRPRGDALMLLMRS